MSLREVSVGDGDVRFRALSNKTHIQGPFESDIFLCRFLLQYFCGLGLQFLEDLFCFTKIGIAQRDLVAPEEVKGPGSSEKPER